MEISYTELEKYLQQGREVEFFYNEKKYSFNHSHVGWHLTEYYNISQDFKNVKDMLKYGRIEGKSIKKIWDDVEIDCLF